MLPFIRTLRSKGLIKAVFEFGNHCRLNLYSTCCRFLPHALRMICLVICRPCSAGVPLETPPIRFAPWVGFLTKILSIFVGEITILCRDHEGRL